MTNQYKTIFISDVHIGTSGSKADILLDFLKNNDSENLYLVGDIIDFWALKSKVVWTQSHNDVVQKLLRKARKGTSVFYIPGNHDEFFRELCPTNFGSIQILRETIYNTIQGKKLLIIHGDDFDGITNCARWLAIVGDRAYSFLISANRYFNFVRRKLGFGYWSLSSYLKSRVKKAVSFINDYEQNIATECKRRNLDGAITGHIHHAEIKEIDGVLYINCGDWVESCTAIVETLEGEFKIIEWHTVNHDDMRSTK